MKRSLLGSARTSVVTSVALSMVLIGSVVAQGPAHEGAVSPAAYYLLGDGGNAGSTSTVFTTTYSGDGWRFAATGLSATALVGQCPNGSACWGVQGTGTEIGVYGSAANPGNPTTEGVRGSGGSTAANGTSYGGYFSASNAASGSRSYGVYGSGATAGVYATSPGNAVYAKSTSTSGNGVYATGSGSNFYGVWGDVSGGGYGVVGTSVGGNGSYGTTSGSTSASGDIAGVYGRNGLSSVGGASVRNSGVHGECTNCNGVSGTSANYVGVRESATGSGTGTYAGYFAAAAGTGVYVKTATGTVAFRAVNAKKTSAYYAGVFDGNVRINGNYVATGTKSAVVTTSEGDRLMYAEEATQNYFSDQGTATLKGGRAVVRIDRLFAQTVDLSKPYMVIVTPQSFDTAGLGVGNLTARSFEVRELGGGNGTFTFSWRITALRKGFTGARMAVAPGDIQPPDADGRAVLPTRATSGDAAVAAPPTHKKAPAAGKHVAQTKKAARH